MEPKQQKAGGCRQWIVRAAVLGVILLLLIIALPRSGFRILAELPFGWLGFLKRVLPRISANWDLIGMAALCLAGFFAGSQWFLKWLAGSTAGRRRTGAGETKLKPEESVTWKPRWTLAINGLLWLSFLIGMSFIGAVHQAGWMTKSEEPLMVVKRGGSSPELMASLIHGNFMLQEIQDRRGLESAVERLRAPDHRKKIFVGMNPEHVRAFLLVDDAGKVNGAIAFRTVYHGQYYSRIGVYDSRNKPARESIERDQLPELMRRYQDELYPFL